MTTKTVKLKNFDDLVEAFPKMTLAQIIDVYKQVQCAIDYLDAKLRECPECEREEVFGQLQEHAKADVLLSGYLARYCC